MKITLLLNGKTEHDYITKGFDIYAQRLKHYLTFDTVVIPALKNTKSLSDLQQKQKEGELILRYLVPGSRMILLDENGKQFSSVAFAEMLQQEMNSGIKNLIFVVGGPYGFSEEVYTRAHGKVSLSKMTFSHQMIRLLIIEQLYRGMTILNNEPYHHQ